MDKTKKVVLLWVEILEAEILSRHGKNKESPYNIHLQHRYQSDSDRLPTEFMTIDISTPILELSIDFYIGDRVEVVHHEKDSLYEYTQIYCQKYVEIKTWNQALSFLRSLSETPPLPTA